ncbi:hypothetical protein LSH36_55g02049 [Paralvinella palmiformis]|uniref:Uncharacterized protein n=1 Tax=Paralvinella palmiformis TaxID=53620 RepID=A0AAD9K6U9_9ANNE|nr:hypothetical protein LSH36_55g02049 [Paralvinella palmiformis]
MYQVSSLNPALWYSCVFEIINLIEFHAAKAISERLYAICDITSRSGDQSEPIQGTIMFEQPVHESRDSFKRPSTYGGRLGCCVITKMATPKFD